MRSGSSDLAVPSTQCRGCNEESSPTLTRTQPLERREECAVGRREVWSGHLAADHGELVTKHRDLDVLVVRHWTDSKEQEKLPNQYEGD